jgi:circadian clock protein KaiC
MSNQSKQSSRCTMGAEGLDDILSGGLPRNRLYLVQGDPGVGKTTLALQFLLEGAKLGETGLYITLSETKEELELVAESHGWKLSRIHIFELSSMQEALQGETESTFFHPSEVELNRTTKALLAKVERVQPARVVFDSLSEMRMLAETPLRYRRQILQLKQYFAGRKCTVLLLDDRSGGARDLQIESIAHGVISLQRSSPEYGISRRQLNVQKIRGVKYREGNHDLIIQRGGLVFFPRLIAAEHHAKFKREDFPSGIKELDTLLGGGLSRGTANMFYGTAGHGQIYMAIKFALAAAKRGKEFAFTFLTKPRQPCCSEPGSSKWTLSLTLKRGLFK